MKSVCGTCRMCRGFHTDVGCSGQMVVRRGPFSITYSLAMLWPLNLLRISACFREWCSVTPVVEIWRGPYAPSLVRDFFGDVKGGLLGPRAISLRPSGTGHGSSWVGSLSRKLWCLLTTSSAANQPTKLKTNIASVIIQSQTGACSARKPCSCFWRADLLKLVVLTRPSKLTNASSVGESIIGDTLLRVSGCLAVLNASLGKHFLFLLRTEPPTH